MQQVQCSDARDQWEEERESARSKYFYALMAGENNSYGRTPAYDRRRKTIGGE